MTQIDKIIGSVLSSMRRSQQVSKDTVRDVVTPAEFEALIAVVPQKDAVLVCVKNAAALYGLRLKKDGLLKKLQEVKPGISAVVFKIGEADGI
jgi:hypothetical protein